MKKSTKTTSAALFIAIGLMVILSSCKKESEDNEEVTPSSRQLYEFSVPGVGFSVGCPTLVNKFIYIGTSTPTSYLPTSTNYFYKLDENLKKIWEYPLGIKQLRGPASLDSYGNIYFVVDSARKMAHGYAPIKILSLDNNGKFRWSKHIDDMDLIGLKGIAIATNNTIYVGGSKLFALDIHGNIKWDYVDPNQPFTGSIGSSPIIDPNGNVYFISRDKVYSVDENGKMRWIYSTGTGSSGVSTPAFSKDHSKLIVAFKKDISSLQTSNGVLNWKYTFEMNADFRAAPAVDDNNVIYIGSHGLGGDNDESTLYALKADGSAILWEFNLGSDFYSSPTLGNDRVLYVGSEGHGNTPDKHNRFHAFDMTNGKILWSAQLYNDVSWGAPILSDKGIIYVTTAFIDGKDPSGIYGFKTDATGLLTNCGSPTFQLSNAHNGRRQ